MVESNIWMVAEKRKKIQEQGSNMNTNRYIKVLQFRFSYICFFHQKTKFVLSHSLTTTFWTERTTLMLFFVFVAFLYLFLNLFCFIFLKFYIILFHTKLFKRWISSLFHFFPFFTLRCTITYICETVQRKFFCL